MCIRHLPLALLLLVCCTAAAPPNVVYIYADDLGYGDWGNTAAVAPRTPNIDRLARGGLVFTDGHATSSTCTPSRYAVLTGRYAFREPNARVLPGDAPLLIKPGTPTLPSVLRSAGYATGCVGKWHVGLGTGAIDWNGEVAPGPLEVGFDESFIVPATPDRVPCVYLDGHRVFHLDPADPITVSYKHKVGDLPTGKERPDLLRYGLSAGHAGTIIDRISRIGWMSGGRAAWWTDETMSDVLATRAEAFLRAHAAGKPFFLYFATNGIHVPRAPSEQFLHSSQTGLRGDTIQELDWVVGRVLDTLDQLKLTDHTLIVFSSDNGPVLDDGYADGAVADAHGVRPAGPLRGGKYSIYEGGTREPFIVSWPGRVKPGTSAALVSQVDLLASLAHLANVPLPSGAGPDSVDVLPALLGDSPTGRDHFIEQSSPVLAIRQGGWKLIPPGDRPRLAALEEGDTAEGPRLTPAGQLFDLAADMGETKNVIADHPDVAKRLTELLQHDRDATATR
jgi:arylsulfatase A-like enzyme